MTQFARTVPRRALLEEALPQLGRETVFAPLDEDRPDLRSARAGEKKGQIAPGFPWEKAFQWFPHRKK